MTEPWITEPEIWEGFCKENETTDYPMAQTLYKSSLIRQENYHWFSLGFKRGIKIYAYREVGS